MFGVNKILQATVVCFSMLMVSNISFAVETGTTQEETKKEPDVKYTGVYKDRQLIPNIMAIHCKVNAEDIVKDITKLKKCIRQYILEMNDENAIVAQEGIADFNTLRYSVVNDLLSVNITKSAAINGYEEEMNKYSDANYKAETEYDTEGALSNTLAFSTDIKNSIREIYVEAIKYVVIDSIGNLNVEALEDDYVEGEEDEQKSDDSSAGEKE